MQDVATAGYCAGCLREPLRQLIFDVGNAHAPQGAIGTAAPIGVGVVLAQSFVDFPLRTPALMSVAAALAGIAVAQAARSRQDDCAPGAGRDLARSS